MSGDGAEESRIARSLNEVLSADHSGLRAAVLDVLALLPDVGASPWLLRTAGALGLLAGPPETAQPETAQPETAQPATTQAATAQPAPSQAATAPVTTAQVDAAVEGLAGASLVRREGAGTAAAVTADPEAARIVLERHARDGSLLPLGARVRTLLDAAIKSGNAVPDVRDLVQAITAFSDTLAPYLGAGDAQLIEDLLDLRGWGLWALSFDPEDAGPAIEAGEPLIADYARVLGPAHPAAWESRRNLGIAYEHAGRYADAIEVYAGLLADQELALPPDDPDLAITRLNLAQAQDAQDDAGWTPDE